MSVTTRAATTMANVRFGNRTDHDPAERGEASVVGCG